LCSDFFAGQNAQDRKQLEEVVEIEHEAMREKMSQIKQETFLTEY